MATTRLLSTAPVVHVVQPLNKNISVRNPEREKEKEKEYERITLRN
jgi:hypothetical protein